VGPQNFPELDRCDVLKQGYVCLPQFSFTGTSRKVDTVSEKIMLD